MISYRIDHGSFGNVNLDYITMYKADVPNPVTPKVDLDTISQLVSEYAKNGTIKHPLASQLSNLLTQSKHHFDKGHKEQAIKKLNDSLRAINNKAMEKYIEEDVKENLNTDLTALLDSLK